MLESRSACWSDRLARWPLFWLAIRFAGEPGNRTVALFVDDPLPADALDHATGLRGEQLRLGEREIYIFYGDGMADLRLRIPAGNAGTARNMNTIAKLVEMATGLSIIVGERKSSTLIGPCDLSVIRQDFAASWAIADKTRRTRHRDPSVGSSLEH